MGGTREEWAENQFLEVQEEESQEVWADGVLGMWEELTRNGELVELVWVGWEELAPKGWEELAQDGWEELVQEVLAQDGWEELAQEEWEELVLGW